jgi:hypothetical protein
MEAEFEAIELAMNTSPQDMVALCKVLGINTDRSMYEIKHDFLRFVKDDPQSFIESLNDPRIERKQVIVEALENGIIKNNSVRKTIDWGGKGGQTITMSPIGVDALDNFVDFTFEKDGELVFDRIVTLLEQKLNPAPAKKAEPKKAKA